MVKETSTKGKENGISGDQLIWGNKYFTFNSNMLFFKEWIKGGILYIKDIYSGGKIQKSSVILEKLISKQNWIRQYSTILKPGRGHRQT